MTHGSLRRPAALPLAVLALLAFAAPASAQRAREMVLATTTSTYDTGLLDSLLPLFKARTGITAKPIAVGTGAALDMARRGEADAVLVHAPEAERAYVESGDLVRGVLVMHNDFLVAGPPEDPAHAHDAPDVIEAMHRIAATGPFVARGDGSGTEKKELELWRAAGIAPASVHGRVETGQGMGATLLVAEERRAYVLTDRGTYLAFKPRLTLVPLVQGDPRLRNIYHAYVVNAGKHPTARRAEGEAFVRFVVSPEAQALIGRFGRAKYGEPLFFPDAIPASSDGADGRPAARAH
jgi:tungstate transport system substrate-binding protein